MVAATAVPGAAYDWEQDDRGQRDIGSSSQSVPAIRCSLASPRQYSVSPGEPSRFGIRLSTVVVPQNAYKTRILGTANVGYDPSFQGEFYRPFDGTQYFVAPQFFGGRTHFNRYVGPARQSDTRDRVAGAMYGGIGTWRFAQLRLGAEAGYDSYSRSMTVDGVRSGVVVSRNPKLRWIFNNQDSGGLPARGTRFEGSAGYLFRATGDYPIFQSEYSTFKPLDRHVTLFALNHRVRALAGKPDYFDQFIAGDQGNMPAFRYQEFHANTLVTAGSGMILHPWPIPHVSSHPGLAFWYEAGRFDLGSQGWKTHQTTSIATFFPTQVGATGLELSFDENGKARFRLMLGSF